ncbi:MAG: hypothetical protein ACRECH_00535 [Nitrososphaerales archaeon]
MVTLVDIVLAFTFGLLGLAIISWLIVISKELVSHSQLFRNVLGLIFLPAPARQDVSRSSFPVRIVVERLVPIVFWLLILVPMIIFPIILILFPLLGIPWTYLLPPVP